MLKTLAENFDIKYFVKMKLANKAKWESKIKEDKGKFACRLCGKSYGTRLGKFSEKLTFKCTDSSLYFRVDLVLKKTINRLQISR